MGLALVSALAQNHSCLVPIGELLLFDRSNSQGTSIRATKVQRKQQRTASLSLIYRLAEFPSQKLAEKISAAAKTSGMTLQNPRAPNRKHKLGRYQRSSVFRGSRNDFGPGERMTSVVRAIPRALRVFSRQHARPWLLQPQQQALVRRATSAAELQFGQPLHETHPHILAAGELTPGISALEYATRRADLARALPANSIAILAASDVKYRSGAVFYKFHQDPNFLYLTGFNEPNAFAIIEKTGPGGEHNFHLYVRPKDPSAEKWEGTRSGVQAAQDVFNADEAGDVGDILTVLKDIVGGKREVYTDIPTEAKAKSTFSKIVFGSGLSPAGSLGEIFKKAKVKALRPFVNELRVTKSDAEIRNLRKAGEASGLAFTEAMRRDFQTESQLGTYLDFRFKDNGCEESAYVPVVAGGENALQIHYVRNDDILEKGKLVTVDAGGEYGGYIADITRAWPPMDDKFTAPQRDLYEMVLGVQKSVLSLCHEDASMSLDKLHDITEHRLSEGLKALGFDMSNNAIDKLFPHHVGHYIGLAVHDAPGFSRTGRLKKNQCVTVEPGVYVDHNERWPEHFRGIGIRIEDSVCIGERSPLVLTKEAAKEIDEIEALRS